MRQYEYTVGGPTDMDGSGKPSYPVLCRSWDDFDQDAEAWTRVVNWYTNRSVAQIEADAFNANWAESVRKIERANSAAGFTPATRFNHYRSGEEMALERFLDRD